MAVAARKDPRLFRPLFKSRPNQLLVDAFKAHLAATAAPETFDRISMTEPPTVGDLVVIHEFPPVRKSLRPGGEMVPCPICSPFSGQYLKGVLIWCPASEAIYAIGYDCAGRLNMQGRLDRALEKHRREVRERDIEDQLLDLIGKVAPLRRWVAAHRAAGKDADRLGREFRRLAPGANDRLKEASRLGGMLTVTEYPGRNAPPGAKPVTREFGRMSGAAFLQGKQDIDLQLGLIDTRLAPLDAGNTEEAWLDRALEIPPAERARAVAVIREALRMSDRLRGRIVSACQFFEPDNLKLIQTWSAAEPGGRRIYCDRLGKKFRFVVGAEAWSGDAGHLTWPSSLPA